MNYRVVFICWCTLFFLISCASRKNLIILLPDPDGQVGQVVVSNKGGTQLLTKSRHVTTVKSADISPTSPVSMKEEEVSKIFGGALSAQPEPPLRFILYFMYSTAELTEESKRQIPEILRAIETRKSKDISIVGHTDRVGTRESNYKLGLERVDIIKAIFITKGFDPSTIECNSHGEDNPLVKTKDEVPEPRNRRVEITVR